MPKLSEEGVAKFLKIMLLGYQKVGKTRSLGTFPMEKGMYIFDFDGGLDTLRIEFPEEVLEKIDYDEYIDPDPKKPTAWTRAKQKLAEFEKLAAKGELPYDVIVLDGSTEALERCMGFVTYGAGRPGGIPHQNDWMPQMWEYKDFVNQMNALPCNNIVIAHEHIIENEATGEVKNVPAITGKLATKIGGKFNLVFRCEAKVIGGKQNYRWLTKNQGIYEAGHRYHKALEDYEEPNFTEVIRKVREYAEKK